MNSASAISARINSHRRASRFERAAWDSRHSEAGRGQAESSSTSPPCTFRRTRSDKIPGPSGVLTDSRWRHFDSQLEELAVDSRCSPQPIGLTHPSNQVANRDSHRRSPWPSARLPRPIASERAPMPADDRVGLQDTEPAPPLRPYPRPQNPEEPVRLLEAQTPRRAELKSGDLVA